MSSSDPFDEVIPFDFLGEPPAPERSVLELKARLRTEQKRRWQTSESGKQSRRNTDKRMRMNERVGRNFVGVDGEGNRTDYLLLRVGDDVLHTGSNLSLEECLEFMCSLPTEGIEYVAYFFDYDVSMMLRKLPGDRIKRLLNREARTRKRKNGSEVLLALDVCDDRFQVEYLPGKEFKVRRRFSEKSFSPWFRVSDVGSFFQCKFLDALKAWGIGSAKELTIIQEGKESREYFETMTEEVQFYNDLECQLLSRLMAKFSAACRGMGYVPKNWQGPGQLAEAMLRAHGIPKRKDIENRLPRDLLASANKAYYGGRFEITACGPIPTPIYSYDINSAYPDVISELPCLEHGTWRIESTRPDDDSLCLCYGTFEPKDGWGDDVYIWGLPFRTPTCHIIFPGAGRGWYWSTEIDQAKHQTFDITKCWIFESHCDCKPFEFVRDLYKLRKKWQRESANPTANNMGLALKLALNSLYGKTAQSIGKAPYANSVYASLITACVRAKLMELVHDISRCDSPENGCGLPIYYLATDGIFSSDPVTENADIGEGLGQWEADIINESLLLVQPGLYISEYITPNADASWVKSRVKTRGIPKKRVKDYSDEFRDCWERLLARKGGSKHPKDYYVEIPFHQFIGLRQANQLSDFGKCGQWLDIPRKFTFAWHGKRDSRRLLKRFGVYRTIPKTGNPYQESLGYSKEIGRWLDENRDWFSIPVWYENQPEEATYNM